MKPAAFDYVRASSVAGAVDVLGDHGDEASVLAGGQSLVAMLNMRLLAPQVLVDINAIKTLHTIRIQDGMLEIGAGVTQARLLRWPELAATVPLLALALPWVGHYQTRARGTVCGSIAHADPSSELPLALKALGGEVVLQSRRGERRVRGDVFQLGMLSTAREADELISGVRFPVAPTGAGFGFREFAVRHGDFALIAVAVQAHAGCLRIGIGGCADGPVATTIGGLSQDATGDDLNAAVADGIANLVAALSLDDDIHASAAYRRRLCTALLRDAAADAVNAMRNRQRE